MDSADTFIPNSLRKHRRLMGFSQKDVMRELGLKSTSMISRWERGQSMPSADNLLKLSILYKTLVNELYYERSKEYQAKLFPDEHIQQKLQHPNRVKRLDRGP